MSLDIEHLRGWIGREEQAVDILSIEMVRRFRATIGVQEEARVPRMVHLCLAPAVASAEALGRDGHPARGGFLPPVPLANRMWAGGSFVFHTDPRENTLIERQSRIEDVTLKQGHSGALCFVTVKHAYWTEGQLLVEERQDIVYRDPPARPPLEQVPAPTGASHEVVDASTVTLFRYSAITFNGHRIHYDIDYAREVEGYPGLVVHGPLQATWLYHFAARIAGRPPDTFDFRSIAPLFHVDRVTLNGEEDADAVSLWTAAEGGSIAMKALARWRDSRTASGRS